VCRAGFVWSLLIRTCLQIVTERQNWGTARSKCESIHNRATLFLTGLKRDEIATVELLKTADEWG